jgi:hypothetical protein
MESEQLRQELDLRGEGPADVFGLGCVLLDGVLLDQDGDEGCSGDGDQGSDDAGEGGAEEQGHEDGEAQEVDAGTHDAGGEDGVFDVDVDGVEDEDAGHFGPGIEGCDAGCEDDGDDAAGDGNDVEQAHEEAKENEVTDVEKTEDDGAGDSQDEHEETLAEEPFADLLLGFFEGGVEAVALGGGEEGEEEAVGGFAFEHEIDAEEDGGEDVEDVGEPEGERGEEVGGRGGEGAFGTLDEGVDAEPGGQGELLEAGDDVGDALGKVDGELAEVVHDRGQAGGEEDDQDHNAGGEEKDDGNRARGMVAAEVELCDADDNGHEDDGEESADVKDQQLLLEGPREGYKKQDGDAEEDIAADRSSGLLLVRGQVREDGGQLVLLWGADFEMQIVCALTA